MSLFDIFSNDAAEDAARAASEGRRQGYAQLSDLYGQGRNAITQGYGQAAGVLGDVAGAYKPGFEAYGDVSGAHGVEGLQRGTDLFRNSGQYGVFGVANDAAQQAVNRQRAASGNAYSGAADYGAAKAASDLAGNYWGQFQQGLQPYLQGYGTAATNLGNVYTGQGNALNASFQGQGGAANATQTGIGADTAGAELNRYNVGANTLNALMGVGNLAMKGAGGAGGFSSLFSGFGGQNDRSNPNNNYAQFGQTYFT